MSKIDLENGKNIVSKIGTILSSLYKKKEIERIDEKINQLENKKAELKGKVNNNKQRNNNETIFDVAYNVNHDEVKAYMNKQDDINQLVSYMAVNNYDEVLINVAKELVIDVVALKYNVTQTTKNFLLRCKKSNVKELSDLEKDYLKNHFVILYATKHKVKNHNVEYKFGNRKAETLKSYSAFRLRCVQDINV